MDWCAQSFLFFFQAEDGIRDLTVTGVQTCALPILPDRGRYLQDNLSITLQFANGSIGTVLYTANGHKGFSKESLEVFGGGMAAQLEEIGRASCRERV